MKKALVFILFIIISISTNAKTLEEVESEYREAYRLRNISEVNLKKQVMKLKKKQQQYFTNGLKKGLSFLKDNFKIKLIREGRINYSNTIKQISKPLISKKSSSTHSSIKVVIPPPHVKIDTEFEEEKIKRLQRSKKEQYENNTQILSSIQEIKKSIHPYKPTENDSIFRIISKTYMRSLTRIYPIEAKPKGIPTYIRKRSFNNGH